MESSRLAWALEFFQDQLVLYGHIACLKNRNRKRSEDEAQGALAKFLVRPWAPSLVLGQGAVSRAPQSCLVSFSRRTQGWEDSSAVLALCCAVFPGSLMGPACLHHQGAQSLQVWGCRGQWFSG